MRRLAALVMTVLGLAGIVCFVMMAGATSPAERAVDGAMVLVVVLAAAGCSLLIWPRRAR